MVGGVSWPSIKSGSPTLLYWQLTWILELLLPILPYALQFYRAQRLQVFTANPFNFIDLCKMPERSILIPLVDLVKDLENRSVSFCFILFPSVCFFLAERRKGWLEDFGPKTVNRYGETQRGDNGGDMTRGKWCKMKNVTFIVCKPEKTAFVRYWNVKIVHICWI